MRRVRICAPNVLAMSRENMAFAHPIFEPYLMYCAPNIKLVPPPLRYHVFTYFRNRNENVMFNILKNLNCYF